MDALLESGFLVWGHISFWWQWAQRSAVKATSALLRMPESSFTFSVSNKYTLFHFPEGIVQSALHKIGVPPIFTTYRTCNGKISTLSYLRFKMFTLLLNWLNRHLCWYISLTVLHFYWYYYYCFPGSSCQRVPICSKGWNNIVNQHISNLTPIISKFEMVTSLIQFFKYEMFGGDPRDSLSPYETLHNGRINTWT